jgi:signal transduction histidine kinase
MPDPSRQITELAQDQDGVIWAVNARGTASLSRFVGGRWETLGQGWDAPEGWIMSMVAARDGVLWVATQDKLFFLRRGARRFETTDAKVALGPGLAEDGAGHIWISDQEGTRRLPDYAAGQTSTRGLPDYPAPGRRLRTKIVFTPDGSLWGATGSAGLFRITHPDGPGVMTTYGVKDGLTDDQTASVFVDREGTVWAGGDRGLNAFVAPSIVDEAAIPAGADEYFIAEDGAGRVYVGDTTGLFVIRPYQPPLRIRQGAMRDVHVCGGYGSAFLVHDGVVEEIKDGRVARSFAMDRPRAMFQCAVSGGGKLWLYSSDHGLAMHDRDGWHDLRGVADLIDAQFAVDRQGRPIIINGFSSLIRIDGGATTTWSAEQLRLGRLTFVHDGSAGLVVGGAAGLARLGVGRIDHIDLRRHPWLRNVRYMLETPDGEVWLFTFSSIVRVSAADLAKAFANPDAPIPHRVFDELDGLTSGSARYDGVRAARGGDGRLWFLGTAGVMRITPGGLMRNDTPPPVLIRAVTAGGRPVSATGGVVLPKGASRLQIDYAALSLRTPSRVRFRFRLVGIDEGWVEAGARRTAFYNNLPPGQYRFTVVAANDDGVWNTTGASLDVTVPPTFWQSRLFLVLCLAAFAVMVWALYRIRLRAVTGRMRTRMNERIAERERIARELHDTLLQGVQGLILRFQLIVDDLPRGQPQRAPLEQALDAADEVLGQARDRVLDLRAADRAEDLEAALSKLAQGGEGGPPVGVFVEGASRALDEIAADEVLAIVGEAVANARAHAGAGCIEIRVVFGPRRLTVSVVDDGRGMAPEILRAGGRHGHFGLAGMRERARTLSGRLVIDSRPGDGTRIVVTIPARTAYVPRPWPSWRERLPWSPRNG